MTKPADGQMFPRRPADFIFRASAGRPAGSVSSRLYESPGRNTEVTSPRGARWFILGTIYTVIKKLDLSNLSHVNQHQSTPTEGRVQLKDTLKATETEEDAGNNRSHWI